MVGQLLFCIYEKEYPFLDPTFIKATGGLVIEYCPCNSLRNPGLSMFGPPISLVVVPFRPQSLVSQIQMLPP